MSVTILHRTEQTTKMVYCYECCKCLLPSDMEHFRMSYATRSGKEILAYGYACCKEHIPFAANK